MDLKTKNKSKIIFGSVTLLDRSLFAKHLSVMLKSGIVLSDALLISADSARGKLKVIINNLYKSVSSGRNFSDALSEYPKYFSGLFISSVKIGESSGTLVENLENISIQLEKEQALRSKIKNSMIYPLVVLCATFILGLVLSFVVLPKITPLFEGLRVELPLTTVWLIKFSNFIQANGLITFISIMALVIVLIWLLNQKFVRPITHYLLIKAPLVKLIVKNANLARFTRNLAMLLKSGVRIDEALDITKNSVGNYYYQNALDKVSQDIRKGTKLADNLSEQENLFPILLTKMIGVGEESGNFEETLFYLADFYEEKVDNAAKTLSTAIEPILLLIIGFAVGFLALSIITPIYDITGNVQR